MIFQLNNLDFNRVLLLDFWWLISKLCCATSELDCWTQFVFFAERIDSYNKPFWDHKYYRNSLVIRSCYEFFICGCIYPYMTLINSLIQVFSVWTNFSYALWSSCILLVLVMESCSEEKVKRALRFNFRYRGYVSNRNTWNTAFFSLVLG